MACLWAEFLLENERINSNIYIIHMSILIYILVVVAKKLGIPRNTHASL